MRIKLIYSKAFLIPILLLSFEFISNTDAVRIGIVKAFYNDPWTQSVTCLLNP